MGRVKLDHAELLERFYARDARYDGTFVVGVLTTGIYCIPSCTARKPKPENVRFFTDESEARATGLRACKRCRPDHFYRKHDPDLELAAELAESVRARPGDFGDSADMVASAGVGLTKLTQLFRRHYHTTPATFLAGARVETAADALLRSARPLLDVALDAGFESQSAFHENFVRATGMTPGAYRRLGEARELVVRLPAGFRRQEVIAMFGRDPEGRTERVDARGRRATKALSLQGKPARLELELSPRRVRCTVRSARRPSRRAMAQAHAVLVRLLGLASDPASFERRLARLQYSRRKAEYLIDTARDIAQRRLDLDALGREPAPRIDARLQAIRGLGPWSVQYLLMRSLGLADCVPVGDTGLTSSLQSFFELDERPGPEETLRLMEAFAPHRSLATFHLWKRLGDPT